MATETGIRILRKRVISRHLDKESIRIICGKLDNSIKMLVEKEIAGINKEWNTSTTFFSINRENFGRINFVFERIGGLLDPDILEEFNSKKHYNKFVQCQKPYLAAIGFLDNDANPGLGALSFNFSGGVALDYNLCSIGANLGSKKSVVAIRLRRWAEETRVRPENLSLWISDDNKLYRRYAGKITFSNEARAMTLDHLDIVCQFLKIHSDFNNNDDKYTFAEDFKRIVEVYGPPDFS